jgi:hypothetical protein
MRSSSLGGIDAKNLKLGLSTSPSVRWELTSNPKVIPKGKVFMCAVNWKGRVTDKKGDWKYSARFDRIVYAEKFRMTCESQSAHIKIEATLSSDDWNQEDDEHKSKKTRVNFISMATKKS